MKILIEITGQEEAALVALAKREARSVTAQARLIVREAIAAHRAQFGLDPIDAEQEEVQP